MVIVKFAARSCTDPMMMIAPPVTFWGKRELRAALVKALELLDEETPMFASVPRDRQRVNSQNESR